MEIQKIFSSYDEYGYEDERLYSVLMNEDEIRMFTGAIKRANKELKRAWLEKKGAGGFLGIGKKTGDEAIKRGRDRLRNELLDTYRLVEYPVPSHLLVGPRKLKSMNLNQRINAKGARDEIRRQLDPSHPHYQVLGENIKNIQGRKNIL